MWTISKARNRKGFTLIELMIVVAIIIVLAAIAIPNYLKMVVRARKSAVMSDMKAIGTALEAYNTDWGGYPDITITAGDNWAAFESALDGDGSDSTNSSSNTSLTGETGPIRYIKKDDLDAFASKVGVANISYSVTNGEYTLTATPTWNGTQYTFTMTGGTITVSQ
jgi:type IV pilus assembly protein PilA